MQVDIQNISSVERKVKIKLDKNRVEKEYDRFLDSAQKTATVKGFRTGQAPKDVLRKHLSDRLKAEVSNRLVHSALLDTMRDHNLSIVGNPVLTENFRENDKRKFVGQFNLDGSFLFEVVAEVQPVLTTINYDNLKIKSRMPTVEELVDKQIYELRMQFCSPEPVQRPAKVGDRALIDFSGFFNDEPFENGSQALFSFEVGTEVVVGGFTEQFIGKSESENFSFNLTMPSDWGDEKVAGKEVRFDCIVYSISELNLPELNDEFAKLSMHDSIANLRAALAIKVSEVELKSAKAVLIEEISDTLLANNPFECPKVWISNEANTIYNRLGIKGKLSETENVRLMEIAERSVKRSFILDKIYESEPSIHIPLEEIQKILANEAARYKQTSEEFLTNLKNSQKYDGFISYHQQLQAIDFLLNRSQVETV